MQRHRAGLTARQVEPYAAAQCEIVTVQPTGDVDFEIVRCGMKPSEIKQGETADLNLRVQNNTAKQLIGDVVWEMGGQEVARMADQTLGGGNTHTFHSGQIDPGVVGIDMQLTGRYENVRFTNP